MRIKLLMRRVLGSIPNDAGAPIVVLMSVFVCAATMVVTIAAGVSESRANLAETYRHVATVDLGGRTEEVFAAKNGKVFHIHHSNSQAFEPPKGLVSQKWLMSKGQVVGSNTFCQSIFTEIYTHVATVDLGDGRLDEIFSVKDGVVYHVYHLASQAFELPKGPVCLNWLQWQSRNAT